MGVKHQCARIQEPKKSYNTTFIQILFITDEYFFKYIYSIQ